VPTGTPERADSAHYGIAGTVYVCQNRVRGRQ
jgi:hypothetical protein